MLTHRSQGTLEKARVTSALRRDCEVSETYCVEYHLQAKPKDDILRHNLTKLRNITFQLHAKPFIL